MKFYLKTFGCQMNDYDSTRMKKLLASVHYTETKNEDEADLILFNTCTVREKAKHKFLSDIGRLEERKEKNKALMIAVGGCLAQVEGEKLLGRMPSVDLVFGVDQVDALPTLLERIQKTKSRLVTTAFDTNPKLSLAYLHADMGSISSFVTIIMGCDKFCSFCIVPFTRGREKSRPPRDILKEIEILVQKGTKEITLLGQNVNSYQYENIGFSHLLRMVSQIPGLSRIRFTSPHPQDFGEDMISSYENLPNLCKHLHLPVQSGSQRVLRRMCRFYKIEKYKEKIEHLRERVPGISVTTDIIVGFPGETKEDFEKTLQLLKDIRYDSIYSFQYSSRSGTKAAMFKDTVPSQEKEERLQKLQKLQDEISLEINQSKIGTTQTVLVEKISKENRLQGRTDGNKLVHFEGDPSLIGQFVIVRLDKAYAHSFLGTLKFAE